MRIRIATRDDIPAIAKVHVDSWRTTYPGLVPDEFLAGLSYEKSSGTWHWIFDSAATDGNFTLVAEDSSGEIVGFANGGRDRSGGSNFTGELNAIYILKQQQGSGLGRRLVAAVAGALALSGIDSMMVWCLSSNSACQFYERLGASRIGDQIVEIGGQPCPESAYGWADTRVLTTTSQPGSSPCP